MNTEMTVAEALDAAADYIDHHGWCQGLDFHPFSGGVCARGAISLGCHRTFIDKNLNLRLVSPDAPDELFLECLNYLRDFIGKSIVDWNDGKTTDPLIVTSTMRGAAALWRAQNAAKIEQTALEIA